MPQTLAEKLLARAAGRKEVRAGEFITGNIDLAVAHEACSMVVKTFSEIGAGKVWARNKIVLTLDHFVPAASEEAAKIHKTVREFVRAQRIRNFFDIGRGGVSHQLLAEQGFVLPGMLVVGTDSHTTTLGAFGAFATGIGPTEMAAVFAAGKLWFRVPESIRVEIRGRAQRQVYAKDIILALIARLGASGASYKALEFGGETVREMELCERLTLCNMAAELDAKTGLVEADDRTRNYLVKEAGLQPEKLGSAFLRADEDAKYRMRIFFDIRNLEPQVACPSSVENVKPISEIAKNKIRLDQVFLGSCTNGRIEDLRIAAEILRDRKIHPDVRFIVSPASERIYRRALKEGILETLANANCIITNAGCSACFGGHIGLLADGEVCISTSNRNFIGRMGSKNAKIYLANPAVAAASAVKGYIADPREL